MARCSRVCGMTPSSAAITSITKSMPVAPASMLCTRPSWPGTSTKPMISPLGPRPIGEAQIDRDAARLLLLEPVGIDAGQLAAPARSCRDRCGRRCRRSWRRLLDAEGQAGAALGLAALLAACSRRARRCRSGRRTCCAPRGRASARRARRPDRAARRRRGGARRPAWPGRRHRRGRRPCATTARRQPTSRSTPSALL